MIKQVANLSVRAAWLLMCCLFVSVVMNVDSAQASQHNHAEIVAAIQNSPKASSWVRNHADGIASLAINVESGGETDVYNGQCCYGILQLDEVMIEQFAGVPAETYQSWGLEQQIDVWTDYASTVIQESAPQKLIAAGTFDGRTVDVGMVLGCVQVGTPNCNKMIDSGSCDGFHDGNGTTVCDFADRINAGINGTPLPPTDPGEEPGTEPGSGTSSPQSPTMCPRDAYGNCVSMSEAMKAGFASGSGIAMERIRALIQILLIAVAMLVIGNAMLGVWRGFAKGQLATADFTHYMTRSLLVILTVAVILTVM